jgi:F-type H+-transporting ATPase subunit delta
MDDAREIVEGFLDYLKETDQMDSFPEVVEMLNQELLKLNQRVKLVSAVPLSDEEMEEIGEALAERFGPNLVLEEEVNPGILGGIQVKYQDQMIDLSISGKLEEISKKIKH